MHAAGRHASRPALGHHHGRPCLPSQPWYSSAAPRAKMKQGGEHGVCLPVCTGQRMLPEAALQLADGRQAACKSSPLDGSGTPSRCSASRQCSLASCTDLAAVTGVQVERCGQDGISTPHNTQLRHVLAAWNPGTTHSASGKQGGPGGGPALQPSPGGEGRAGACGGLTRHLHGDAHGGHAALPVRAAQARHHQPRRACQSRRKRGGCGCNRCWIAAGMTAWQA